MAVEQIENREQKGLDFAALRAKALEVIPDEPAPEAKEIPNTEPVARTEPVERTEEVKTTVSTSGEPQPVELSDDALVKIKVDGQVKTVKYSEFKERLQKEEVWTQRQQALAQQRREAEQQIQAQVQELQRAAQLIALREQALTQQDPVAKLVAALKPAPAEPAPTDIVTIADLRQQIGQLEQAAKHAGEQHRQEFQTQLTTAAQALREQWAIQQDAQTFTNGLQGIISKADYAPLLDVIPNFEQNLRFQAYSLGPQNVPQAIEFAQKVADEWLGKWKSSHQGATAKAEAARAKAGLEPSIGSDPKPKVKVESTRALKKNGSIDWKELQRRALAVIE